MKTPLPTKLLRRRPRSGQAGLTVIETLISVIVVVVAVGGTLTSMSSMVVLEDASRQTTLAYLEAQRTIERLRTVPFEEVFARFNGDPDDDPAGANTAPGDGFAIADLRPWEDDADGRVGSIHFPVAENDPGKLLETVKMGGRTYDLDADGKLTGKDVSGTYAVLPVRVRLEWTSPSGRRYVELQTLLTRP